MSGAAQGQPGRWGSDRESIDILRQSFRLFDKNGDGDISAVELKGVLCNLGEKPTEEMVGAMIDLADIDGNGAVGFDEFVLLMTGRPLPVARSPGTGDHTAFAQLDVVRQLFNAADTDGSGFLDMGEVCDVAAQLVEREMLPDLGKRLKKKNQMDMMEELNPDLHVDPSTGKPACDFTQFRQWMEAMNQHWTELLVLPEALIYSIREDALRRKLLPGAESPQSMWQRLAILLRLLADRHTVWGNPRDLYGQASMAAQATAYKGGAGHSDKRLAMNTWLRTKKGSDGDGADGAGGRRVQ